MFILLIKLSLNIVRIMKHHTNSVFGLGLSVVALVYLFGCKAEGSDLSISNLFNRWDNLCLFNKKDSKDVFICAEPDNFRRNTVSYTKTTPVPFCEPDCCDEKRVKSFDPCIDVTPSARGCIETTGPYLEAAYIYWRSSIEDLTVTSNLQQQGTNQAKETIKQIDYKYDSGFKLGLGYNLSYDYWDIFANWTRLHTEPSSSWSSANQGLNAFLLAPIEGFNTLGSSSVSSHWNLHFDTIDLELGRRLFLGRNLAIRPYAGLKGAWVTSRLRTSYTGINNPDLNAANVFLKDRNQGIGLRFGMQGRWDLGCSNFAILTNIAGGILWNNIKTRNNTSEFPVNTSQGVGSFIKEAHYRTLKPLVECFIGLDWGSCFCKQYYLGVSAGYEMQFWWDYNTFFTQPGSTSMYDLRLHGLTATVTIDF